MIWTSKQHAEHPFASRKIHQTVTAVRVTLDLASQPPIHPPILRPKLLNAWPFIFKPILPNLNLKILLLLIPVKGKLASNYFPFFGSAVHFAGAFYSSFVI